MNAVGACSVVTSLDGGEPINSIPPRSSARIYCIVVEARKRPRSLARVTDVLSLGARIETDLQQQTNCLVIGRSCTVVAQSSRYLAEVLGT